MGYSMLNHIERAEAFAERLRRRINENNLHWLPTFPSRILPAFAAFAAVAALSTGVATAGPKPPSAFCAGSSDCPPPAAEPSGEPLEDPVKQVSDRQGAIKWHPGHYMQVLRGSADSEQAARFPYYDGIAQNRDIEGVSVWFRWSQLEKARGDYSAGIELIRTELDYLKSLAVPKRLVIQVLDAAYGSTCPARDYFPSYLDSNGGLFQTQNQCVWRRWDTKTMGHFIDLMAALGKAFDGDPYVEMIVPFHETAIGWNKTPFPGDYSESKLDEQYRRLAGAMREAWPTTIVRFPTNWGLNGGRMEKFVAHLGSIGAGAGNPDTCPSCGMAIDSMLTGEIGGQDYRGVIPIVMGVEVSELGYDSVGPSGGFTVQQIYDYAHDDKGSTHILWDRNVVVGKSGSDPKSGQRWDAMLKLISAQPVEHVACPSAFEQGCRTD